MQKFSKKDTSIKKDSNQSQMSSFGSYSPNKRISRQKSIKSSRPASVEPALRFPKEDLPSQVSFYFLKFKFLPILVIK